MWQDRDVTVASLVALMYNQRLRTPDDLLSRIRKPHGVEGKQLAYELLFHSRVARFLRLPGIPDHPDVYAATSHTREEVLASQNDLTYRARLFLRCLKTKELLPCTRSYRISVRGSLIAYRSLFNHVHSVSFRQNMAPQRRRRTYPAVSDLFSPIDSSSYQGFRPALVPRSCSSE